MPGSPTIWSNSSIGCSGDQATISVIGPMSVRVSAGEMQRNSPIASTCSINALRSSKCMLNPRGGDQVADASWIERHAAHSRPERAQRILDSVGNRGRNGQGAGLASAFDAERIDRARRGLMKDLDARHLARRRQGIVQETGCEWLAVLVEHGLLVERVAQAVGYSADDLTFDNQRIDDVPAIVSDDVAHDPHLPAIGIHVENAHVAASAVASLRWCEIRRGLEAN